MKMQSVVVMESGFTSNGAAGIVEWEVALRFWKERFGVSPAMIRIHPDDMAQVVAAVVDQVGSHAIQRFTVDHTGNPTVVEDLDRATERPPEVSYYLNRWAGGVMIPVVKDGRVERNGTLYVVDIPISVG